LAGPTNQNNGNNGNQNRNAADTEVDCVVTAFGVAGGAVAEGDLVMPDCKHLTATPATPFWNKLLP
jgi:hypothetical protein